MAETNRVRLRQAVQRSGMTPGQVARQIGVTRPALLHWMSGRKQPSETNQIVLAIWSGGDVPKDGWPTAARNARRIAGVVPLPRHSDCSRGRGQRKPERLRSQEKSR